MAEPRKQDPSFEEAYTQLEAHVKALEAGGLTLAEATRIFEEGMRLARRCAELLASAELRVQRLQTAFGEQMRLLEQTEEEQ